MSSSVEDGPRESYRYLPKYAFTSRPGQKIVGTDPDDWRLAGRCLARYAERWERVLPRDHLADALVAVTAARAPRPRRALRSVRDDFETGHAGEVFDVAGDERRALHDR